MVDVIIKNGTVIDGTGGHRFTADIAVADGKIVRIAPAIKEEAKEIIDASGLVVTPGFIDYHSHSDCVFLLGTDAYNYIEQGITTQITGHCGVSPVPYFPGQMEEIRQAVTPGKWEELMAVCDNCESFMHHVAGMELGTNMAFYIGQSNIRGRVMYYSAEKPGEKELGEMKDWVRRAMECGYLGFSSGLVYTPSVYADTEELIELAKVMAPYGGSYVSHIRGEGDSVIEAAKEAIEIGRMAQVPVVISHLKVEGKHNEGRSEDLLRLIEEANEAGITTHADQYPFLAGAAALISQIPPKYAVEGNDILVEKLKDPAFREKVRHSIFHEVHEFESGIYASGYEGCLILEAPGVPGAVGKTIAQIAQGEGKDPMDVACELIIQTGGLVSSAYVCQNESDMMRILAHPLVMGGTDYMDNPVHIDPEKEGGGHPRGTGAMIRRLQLTRDHGLATLEEAVYRITGLPAQVSGLPGIGELREGNRADLCIFDYAKLRCNADLTHPFRKNEGLHTVLLGGAVALREGTATGIKNGIVLRRPVK